MKVTEGERTYILSYLREMKKRFESEMRRDGYTLKGEVWTHKDGRSVDWDTAWDEWTSANYPPTDARTKTI